MDSLRYVIGERKYVRLFVYSLKNEPFYVRDAEYNLLNPTGETETHGTCEITRVENGTNILVLLEPQEEGLYTLKIQYDIGEEHLKKNIEIEVIPDD